MEAQSPAMSWTSGEVPKRQSLNLDPLWAPLATFSCCVLPLGLRQLDVSSDLSVPDLISWGLRDLDTIEEPGICWKVLGPGSGLWPHTSGLFLGTPLAAPGDRHLGTPESVGRHLLPSPQPWVTLAFALQQLLGPCH